MMNLSRLVAPLIIAGWFATAAGLLAAQDVRPLTAEERTSLERESAALGQQLRDLMSAQSTPADVSRVADAAIFQKGLQWALRYDTEFRPDDIALLRKAITRCTERQQQLSTGKSGWADRRGQVARGYVSAVDSSVQPYGLYVPSNYDPQRPMRLDVVLHGSTRPVGLSELRFIARFDRGDDLATEPVEERPYIELHPLGRVENCYRWAGETDVFEAIEDVCRKYNIDRDRIVLRGMSMGASGTWHLGLKHPDRFVALGPYCGYVDTRNFSKTPLKHFLVVDELPAHQDLGLHMLDSVDYAANAGVVPAIACMGEKDTFFDAHVIMGRAMEQEGLKMVNLISPGTGHTVDPATHAEQMRRIKEYADRGLDHAPLSLRFVTWTLKYSRCHWLDVLSLGRHYERAEIAATLPETGGVEIKDVRNITRFALRPPASARAAQAGKVQIQDSTVPVIAEQASKESTSRVVFELRDKTWRCLGNPASNATSGKRPGLQGPIDDAFTSRFLCVRGTGQPWNASVQTYADASLKRFAEEWSHYFRGELPVKDDAQVTPEDLAQSNLILFGDPGSNRWIAQALPQLPLSWTKETLRLGSESVPAAKHVPALITASPLPGAQGRYLVLNSGHTFREKELAAVNYLLFPRWGDWALLKIEQPASSPDLEAVIHAGYFDENWKLPSP